MFKLVFIIFTIISFTQCAYGKSEVIKMGFYTVEPHTIVCEKPNKPCGAMVEYVEKYLAPNLKIKIDWVGPMSILRAVEQLLKKKIDSFPLAGKIVGSSNKNFAELTKNKTHGGKWFLMTTKNFKKKEIQSSKDLYGLNIGFYHSLKSFDHPFLSDKNIKLHNMTGSRWFERNFLMTEMKRFDSVIMPEEAPIRYMLKKYKAAHKYKVIQIPGLEIDFHFAISNSDKAKRFKVALDKAIEKAPITYEAYLEYYLKNKVHFDKFNMN
ncbi:hypothetical protein A9Q84_16770 [Halobacteriovorax marinus]|uniref:Solute-binding protein family 3/N-terminal domain-containing protein n=1 Tax=Halobacteriovorax marinus TaxID=97084 RepID=A0A1Y5F4I3_9BACT|nr:hypothetical protein A9Q84_16770 [Halobacteriovorax marinus]